MQVVELVEILRNHKAGRGDVVDTLATGLLLRKVIADHRSGHIGSDVDLSSKLAELSDEYFDRTVDEAQSQVKDFGYIALGVAVHDLLDEIQDNLSITKSNQEALRDLHAQIEPFKQSITFTTSELKKKPWSKVSGKQFIYSIIASIAASLVVSLTIAYIGWAEQMQNIELLTEQVCAQNPTLDCPE